VIGCVLLDSLYGLGLMISGDRARMFSQSSLDYTLHGVSVIGLCRVPGSNDDSWCHVHTRLDELSVTDNALDMHYGTGVHMRFVHGSAKFPGGSYVNFVRPEAGYRFRPRENGLSVVYRDPRVSLQIAVVLLKSKDRSRRPVHGPGICTQATDALNPNELSKRVGDRQGKLRPSSCNAEKAEEGK
jgi:hypothetical protein